MSMNRSISTIFLSILLLCPLQSRAETFSTSTQSYQDSDITCIESNCEVTCNTVLGCSNAVLDASASETLILSCLAEDACTGLTIVTGAQTSTAITCSSVRACSTASFDVQTSSNVVLNCNAPDLTTANDGSCYETILHVDTSVTVDVNCDSDYNCDSISIYAAQVTDVLNFNCNGYDNCAWAEVYCPLANKCSITCSGDAFSCTYMDIYIDNVDSDFHIACTDSDSQSQYACSGTDIHCESTDKSSELYFDGTDAWSCHMDECCPTYFYRGTKSCDITQSTECNMDCVTIDCSRYIIDGTAASSLAVTCNQNTGGCGVTNILCPVNGECTVDCQGEKSCYAAFVKATDSNSLQLDCVGTKSCHEMDINCPSNPTNNNAGCTVNCDGSNACYYSNIEATYSYSLDLLCRGDRACFGLQPIYCPSDREGVCNVDCSDDVNKLCFGMIFYVLPNFVADALYLQCPRTSTNDVCGNQLFQCTYLSGVSYKSSVWMGFDETQSQYQCQSTLEDDCCPLASEVPIITGVPSQSPTVNTPNPSESPSKFPTVNTVNPSQYPSQYTQSPSRASPSPTDHPSNPTDNPSQSPTGYAQNPSIDDEPIGGNNTVRLELSFIAHVVICVVIKLNL